MQDLIIDVGMHWGRDTEFYIAKGFRVAAVEANPDLAQKNAARFADHLDTGRLRILNVAVAPHSGTLPFWIVDTNDDWSTSDERFAKRNEAMGVKSRQITVPCRNFGEILDECGTPYYLKIDIEGSDLLCLQALNGRERPKYVSVEATLDSFEDVFTQLSTLWNLGYDRFKLVNQGLCHSWRCPNPPREGEYVDVRFDDFCSGPFGEETPGEWIPIEEAVTTCRRLVQEHRYDRYGGIYGHTVRARFYRRLRRSLGNPLAWYDIHARLGCTER